MSDSEKNWQQLVAALADGVIIINQTGIIIYANNPAAKLFGRQPNQLIGENFLHPLSANEVQEIEVLGPNTEIIIAEMNVKQGVWKDEPAWIVSLRDITQRKKQIEQLEVASRVFNHALEGIMVTDDKMIMIETNPALTRILGYSKKELLGKNPRILKSERQKPNFFKEMWASISKTGHWQGEIWDKHKNGEDIPTFLTISVVKNEEAEITNYIGFCHDLIFQKKQQAKIEHMRYYDALTNLPNENFLSENLDSLMNCIQEPESTIVIVYIAIDGLNSIHNDQMSENDKKNTLIVTTARRLKIALGNNVFLARINYNGFVAVFDKFKNVTNIFPKVQQVIEELSLPYHLDGKNIRLTANIGITSYPQKHLCFSEELIRQAYLAAYDAKLTGENQYVFFDQRLELQKIQYTQLIHDLHDALVNNHLLVFYQPKVNMCTGEVIGAEALLRLNHPTKGLLTPDRFLTGIENNPILAEVGEWVLEQALKQIEQWLNLNHTISVSINVTPYHLQQANFASRLEEILAKHPLVKNHLIELEVLEIEALTEIEAVRKIINQCRKLGVAFALDDFGTGYSTFAYIKDLPATRVKLDHVFVSEILTKPESIPILKACISMCKSLEKDIIAEGVETISHGKLLMYLGCDYGQGYAIAKPMSVDDFNTWLAHWKPIPEWTLTAQQKKEGKLLISAAIGHYSRFGAIKQALTSTDAVCLIYSTNSCPLGRRLKRQTGLQQGSIELNDLEFSHNKLHEQIKEIIALHYLGNNSLALKQLETLELLSANLLTQLFSRL